MPINVLRREIDKQVQWKPHSITVDSAPRWKLEKERLAKKERREEKERKSGPVRILAGGIGSSVLKSPTVVLKLENASMRDVIAFTVEVECFNNFDEPVNGINGKNVFRGISQERLKAGAGDTAVWDLNFQRTTTKIVVHVARVKYADGEELMTLVWRPDMVRQCF